MGDCFALLEVERRPWLDPEMLKQKFLAASARLHPDKAAGDQAAAQEAYAKLNRAYTRLKEPKARLQHLIELERGEKPKELQQIPAGLMAFFMEAGQLCREADEHLARAAAVISPLLKVERFEKAQVLVEKLTAFQKKAKEWEQELHSRLLVADRRWAAARPDHKQEWLAELEELYRLFGFSARWNEQINERLVRLSLE